LVTLADMDAPWTARSLEHARFLAVARVLDGDTAAEAAEVAGVSLRSVRRWMHSWRIRGDEGLLSHFSPGAPRKLTQSQESQVLAWLEASPIQFGFPTERWTAVRVAVLIEHFFGVLMNHRYLNDWFSRRHVSPQLPQRVPHERKPQVIDDWMRYRWPRIKKKPKTVAEPLFLQTKVDSCSHPWLA
jgi:transposase